MAWFRKKKDNSQLKPGIKAKISELNEEDKDNITKMLNEDAAPRDIAEELDFDVQLIYRFKRLHYNDQSTRPGSKHHDPLNEIKEIQTQLQVQDNISLQAQDLRNELEFRQQKRTLELETMRLDIEERKADLLPEIFEDEESLLPDLFRYLKDLAEAKSTPQITSQSNLTPGANPGNGHSAKQDQNPGVPPSNVKVEFDDQTLLEHISKLTPIQKNAAKKMSDEKLNEYINQHEPALGEKSRRRLVELIKGK